MNPPSTSRRRFLKTTGAALAAPVILPSSILGNTRTPPSERITLGVVGLGGNGMGSLSNFLQHEDVQVVAVCDVDRGHSRDKPRSNTPRFGREPGLQMVEEFYAKGERSGDFNGCDSCTDFRELCTRDDIDAIAVSTPDHWHALCTLEALRAGKDVYCEKPITHLFTEGQAVYREAAKQNAIFQTGSQQRSQIRFRVAAEAVLNGLIGKVRRVEVGLPKGYSQPVNEPSTPADAPSGLDYDLWCGPSEKLPYVFARHHRNWRWHSAFGGGQLMDWIGHHNDIAHWGIGMDESGPESVEAVGWTWPETDVYNTAVDYEVRCTYPGGIESTISSKKPMGTKWIGEDGWIHVDRNTIDASDRRWVSEKFDRGPIKAYVSLDHRRNFLDGIRSRKPCIAPAETGHRSITPGHLALVSQALGRKLQWNAATETVLDDKEADQLLKAVDYRKPWAI
ncbi:MAG: Gfo/Idh/MocA family oxidoreductase [Verrucomicrobiota bacterium]